MPKIHRDRPPSYPVGVLPAAAPPEPDPPFSIPAAPAVKASIAEWQAYARALGFSTAGMTKAEIRKAVGA